MPYSISLDLSALHEQERKQAFQQNNMPRLDSDEDHLDNYAQASIKTLYVKAQQVVAKEISKSSVLFECEGSNDNIPHFHIDELILGRVVGRGGFCVVRELTKIRLLQSQSSSESEAVEENNKNTKRTTTPTLLKSLSSGAELISSREHLARRVYSKKGGKYVIKQVDNELLSTDKITYLKGIIDLAMEVQFLQVLQHPHILSLRGLATRTSSSSLCGNQDDDDKNENGTSSSIGIKIDNCIILDYLQETLPKRLTGWMHEKRATCGVTGFLTNGNRGRQQKTMKLYTDRILVSYDIAEAMDYIHSKNIVYRDLKPDNVGFDMNGETKLFDFGLAKSLTGQTQDNDGLYPQLTGLTGGIRYMAPEVGLCHPYSNKADVYSWSMVMWYILALEPPMGMYTPNMFLDRVFGKNYRPIIKDKWSTRISELLRKSWSPDIFERPTFREILFQLKDEVKSTDPQVALLMEIPPPAGAL